MARDLSDTVPGQVLEAFGFEDASCERLVNGQVNAHWLAERRDERIVIARHHVSRAAASVAWEQTLREFAGSRGWPVAAPRNAANGATIFELGGRLWSAEGYLEGDHPSETSVPMHHIYGRLLARLHRDLQLFPVEGQRPGVGKLWELDTWVAPAESGSFNDLLALFGAEHSDLAAGVRRYRYRSLRELSRLHYPDLPDRPIHGDWGAKNLLWKDGALSGVLDFDWCRREALACDLAGMLPWDDSNPGLEAALLRGYEEERPLDDTEWEVLPALARAHLLFFIAFRLVEWRMIGGERPAHSIGRTVRERLPRTERLERTIGELRAAGRRVGR
jgi:homoserine kinase type II